MNDGARKAGPDGARSRLRATIAAMEREAALLAGSESLKASLADLVDQLALGPEPDVRDCPVCGEIGMRAATVCSYCWTKLTPPGSSS